jgi:hypothetical protein
MTGRSNLRTLERTLAATAMELADLASIANELEHTTTGIDGRLDDLTISRLQMADVLTQRLAGLTVFVTALADSAPDGVSLDVGEAVLQLTLADQAARLCGAPPPRVWHEQDDGDLMLFGD